MQPLASMGCVASVATLLHLRSLSRPAGWDATTLTALAGAASVTATTSLG